MENENKNEQKNHNQPQPEKKPKKSFGQRLKDNPWVTMPGIAVLVVAIVFAFFYVRVSSSQIYIEDSTITAPTITLSPSTPGILQQLDVHPGDMVQANQTVAQVGNELVNTKIAGEVISTENNIGQLINPGDPLVVMIDPTQLRVVGSIEEDKGLSSIKVGQTAFFTVDAFGSQKFPGVVDEIAPTDNASDVVFNISDAREEQDFSIYVRYNTAQYPQFLNGMSARIWVLK